MKVVLFCAGRGTRIRDYSEDVPKPLVPIGARPILLHVMDYYSRYGHRDFIVCLGHKAATFRDYIQRMSTHEEPAEADHASTVVITPGAYSETCRVQLVDTLAQSNIGQRLWAVRDEVRDDSMFMANYSDGLTDVDLDEMVARFRDSDKAACFLAVRPPLTYHVANFDESGDLKAFQPAKQSDIWINGGYFLFRPEVFDYMVDGEDLVDGLFPRLIKAGKLMAYRHEGFWYAMDTLRDRQALEEMVSAGQTPWLPDIRPLQATARRR